MTLFEGSPNNQYEVLGFNVEDEELESFLFSLGCYKGETVGYVSTNGKTIVLSIRDGRYNIDNNLAKAILVAEK